MGENHSLTRQSAKRNVKRLWKTSYPTAARRQVTSPTPRRSFPTPDRRAASKQKVKTQQERPPAGGADPGWYEQAALSAPVRLAEDFLIQVQQTSGLPWWLSIAFSTLTIRTLVTLPLAAYQMRVLAKVAPNKLHLEGRVLPGDVYLLENPTHPYPRNPEGFIKRAFLTQILVVQRRRGAGGGHTQMGLQMSRLVRHLQRADKSFSDAFFVITVTHLRNHGNPQVEALQTEIATLAERLRYQVSLRASERGWTDKQSRFQFRKNLRRLVSQLYVRDNCHPFKASLLVWVQLPLWIGLSLALRNLCAPHSLLHTSLATGGTLWFPDLTSPDSTWLLPLALGLTNLFIVERSNVSSVHKAVTNAMRMLSLLMIPIAAGVPSASFSIPPGDGALLVVLQLGGFQSQSSASRSRSSPDPQTSHAAFRHALQRPDGRRRQEVPQVNGKSLAAVREVAPKPTHRRVWVQLKDKVLGR
ncbi:cytochrome c oxidase assembly protein COX18, mitochondrial isoform X2 [Syngnathus scovelli]|uniref:cytochrome c oxidase assembly protein COX18, mitochondrial isoform X2 n=1 Tax=Syngnathus scovelli TaxID=161590 RepID=UPI00210FB0D5|nr:uncharacterized protein LOC125973684 isoform X2 [Syngnathus scovelli]